MHRKNDEAPQGPTERDRSAPGGTGLGMDSRGAGERPDEDGVQDAPFDRYSDARSRWRGLQ